MVSLTHIFTLNHTTTTITTTIGINHTTLVQTA